MKCFDNSKYELIGYSQSLGSYVFRSRLFDDEVVLVKQAVITNHELGVVKLPQRTRSEEDTPNFEPLRMVSV